MKIQIQQSLAEGAHFSACVACHQCVHVDTLGARLSMYDHRQFATMFSPAPTTDSEGLRPVGMGWDAEPEAMHGNSSSYNRICHISARPPPLRLDRRGANGYVLSMGTKIWDPERSPEQGPEQTPEHGPEWKN